jgi:predicted fused transcriptional regulator/phosphomethylpyrimidine kinase
LGVHAQVWLPRLHIVITNGLVEKGWPQDQIAQLLGTTQSTISRWLKRPIPSMSREDDFIVDTAATRILDELIRYGSPIRPLSLTISSNKPDPDWSVELSLTTLAEGSAVERSSLLSSLTRIANDLPTIPAVVCPAVGINIAACTSTAFDRGDVAAFPGRLLTGTGEVTNRIPPDFGASRHLAGILLNLHSVGSDATAIINLRPPRIEVIHRYLLKEQLTINEAPRGISEKPADLLLDTGDFGWEPALYITAANLTSLAVRLDAFIDYLKQNHTLLER